MDDLSLPNMDGMWPDDLRELAEVLETAALYAKLTARAMQHRMVGDINAAIKLEKRAEISYRGLPAGVRW